MEVPDQESQTTSQQRFGLQGWRPCSDQEEMDYSKDVYQMVTVEGNCQGYPTTNLDILVAPLTSITDN